MLLIAALLHLFFLAVPDAEGWVALDHPTEYVEDEKDLSGAWVLFSLALEKEHFWVQFPKDPAYLYTPEGVQLEVKSDEGDFCLSVTEAGAEISLHKLFKGPSLDETGRGHLFYKQGDLWISEEYILSPHYLYHFQTQSHLSDRALHQKFQSSLRIDFPS